MGFLKLKLRWVLLCILACVPALYAEEEPPAPAKETPGKPESYQQLDAKVNAMKIKAEGHRKKIKELAETKSVQTDESAIRLMLDEMVSEAKEMKKTLINFRKAKKRLTYSYPAKGTEIDQKYRHFEVEMVEEMNSLSNIDLRLKGLLTEVEQAYIQPTEVKEIEKRRKGSSSQGESHRATIKEQPTPVEARPKLSY